MSRRHLIIAIVVALVVALFAITIFSSNYFVAEANRDAGQEGPNSDGLGGNITTED